MAEKNRWTREDNLRDQAWASDQVNSSRTIGGPSLPDYNRAAYTWKAVDKMTKEELKEWEDARSECQRDDKWGEGI